MITFLARFIQIISLIYLHLFHFIFLIFNARAKSREAHIMHLKKMLYISERAMIKAEPLVSFSQSDEELFSTRVKNGYL